MFGFMRPKTHEQAIAPLTKIADNLRHIAEVKDNEAADAEVAKQEHAARAEAARAERTKANFAASKIATLFA